MYIFVDIFSIRMGVYIDKLIFYVKYEDTHRMKVDMTYLLEKEKNVILDVSLVPKNYQEKTIETDTR